MAGIKVEGFEQYGELDAYQAKLAAFLKPLTKKPEILSSEPKLPWPQPTAAIEALLANPKNVKNDTDFEALTGWNHFRLLRRWETDRTTTCNEFVRKATNAMGFGHFMMGSVKSGIGRFDIADALTRVGLAHCWVDANSGDLPEFGDPFRLLGAEIDKNTGLRKNHMGISLKVDGARWTVAEGGQGGSLAGQDKVKINEHGWKPHDLTGWVSMRAMLNVGRQTPSWLGGWWEVLEDIYPGYYFFSGAGNVFWTMHPPSNPTAVPGMAMTHGTFQVPNVDSTIVKIHWQSSDWDEEWNVFEQDSKHRKWRMAGKTAQGKKLEGKRVLFKDAADRVPEAA